MTVLGQYPDSSGDFNRNSCEQLYKPFQETMRALVADGWVTPDTYSKVFEPVEDAPAVYLFLVVDRTEFERAIIAYVGMSTRLKQRLSGHPILTEIQSENHWTMRWFRPTKPEALRAVEASYIRKFSPPWNIVHKPRGVILQ